MHYSNMKFLLLCQNISKKMALTSFLENMTGLCDGGDFPKELLKVCLQSSVDGVGREAHPTPGA